MFFLKKGNSFFLSYSAYNWTALSANSVPSFLLINFVKYANCNRGWRTILSITKDGSTESALSSRSRRALSELIVISSVIWFLTRSNSWCLSMTLKIWKSWQDINIFNAFSYFLSYRYKWASASIRIRSVSSIFEKSPDLLISWILHCAWSIMNPVWYKSGLHVWTSRRKSFGSLKRHALSTSS